ncbi:MAG: hypothetical protein MPEBLZ_01225, partial [Candidatus Methanoperedens nitroreducens]
EVVYGASVTLGERGYIKNIICLPKYSYMMKCNVFTGVK